MAINILTASGNIGSDMDVRYTPNGKAIGQFSLPVKQGWGDNEKVSWVSCKMFGERAEKMAQYLTKGTKVTVSGEFAMDEWEKDGVKHSRPTLIVNSLDFGGNGQSNNQAQPQQQRQAPQQREPMPPQDIMDDDIPFAPIGLTNRALLHAL